MENILNKIKELLKQEEENREKPFLDDFEQGCIQGKTEILGDIILLIEQELNI